MLRLAGIFGDGMVLQRDRICTVFGKDDQASEVVLSFEGKEYRSPVKDGSFLISIEPHAVSTGLTMTVKGSTEIEIRDVCMAEDEIAELPRNSWTAAIPGKIGEMSATGFYTAKRIYDEKKIPLGLVLGAQGGSTIESWMPVEILSRFGDFEDQMKPFMGKNALTDYLKKRDAGIASWRDALSEENEEK